MFGLGNRKHAAIKTILQSFPMKKLSQSFTPSVTVTAAGQPNDLKYLVSTFHKAVTATVWPHHQSTRR